MGNRLFDQVFQDLKVLVIDDEEALGAAIENELKAVGADVRRATSLGEARSIFSAFNPDLAISDLNLPDGNGLDLVRKWRLEYSTMPVILITAHPAVDSAITAVRLGAFDYLQKPFAMENLLTAAKRAAEVSRLRQRVGLLEGHEKTRESFSIIGDAKPMKRLKETLRKVAKSKVDVVLIEGESGAGKELAARALHQWSVRAKEPFVEINCASIPDNLLESELFGFEKGAFTDARDRKPGLFEMARTGSIFLDEIGELPLKLQAKLLRVLEYRRFKRLGGTKDIDFEGRIIAATNRNLRGEVEDTRFRSDLYYRLSGITIDVPSLREHLEDIGLLAQHLVERLAADLEITMPKIAPETITALKQHDWPGNVRELKNCLQRALVFHEPEVLLVKHIELAPIRPRQKSTAAATSAPGALTVDPESSLVNLPKDGLNLEDVEKSLLTQALVQAHYNQTKAASLLGITRHTLRYRLDKFGLLQGEK